MKEYSLHSLVFILISITFWGCVKKDDEELKTHINYLKAYDIPVSEPSGLDLTYTESGFWTVSDENSTVYKLDNWGKIEKSFTVKGGDLEGVSVVDDKTIAVVLERGREIALLDTSGNELKRTKVDLEGELNKRNIAKESMEVSEVLRRARIEGRDPQAVLRQRGFNV